MIKHGMIYDGSVDGVIAASAVITRYLPFDNSDGNISLFVDNLDSTDVVVTFEIGYINQADITGTSKASDYTYVTPRPGGTITWTDATTTITANDELHADLTIDPCKYVKFIITNNDAVNDAIINLSFAYAEDN